MILDFTISNFRSIKSAQTISFEATEDKHLEEYYVVKKDKYRVLKMAYILGSNASGKSNVIRAFSMLPILMLYPCENKSSKIEYKRFALDQKVDGEPTVMVVNFLCDEKKYCYEVHFDNNYVSYEKLMAHPFGEQRQHKVYERFLDTDTMLSTIKWGDKYRSALNTRNLTINLLPNRTLFGSYQSSNVDIPWMKSIVDWANSYFMPIVKTSEQDLKGYTAQMLDANKIEHQHVARLMQQADFGVSDFQVDTEKKKLSKDSLTSILSDNDAPKELKEQLQRDPTVSRLVVRMMHRGVQGDIPFEISEESNGTKRYFELSSILLLLAKDSHFVTIDELDNKLHPDLYKYFINTYLRNASDSQLVFTTHNREFLSDRDFYRDDAVWFTEKDEWGATELFSLVEFDSSVIRDSTNRYNAYRNGRLGAVPNLSDYYVLD